MIRGGEGRMSLEIYFSTVVRSAPPDRGGELVRLDWESKQVKATVTIAPTNPDLPDPNPRGNTRGGRGVAILGDEVWVASYHTLKVFDRDLRPLRDVTHPLMVGLHEIFPTDRGSIWVTSTAIDAALEIDTSSGKALRELWPREQRAFQEHLGLAPLEIDKRVDNRARFLSNVHLKNESHIHLNAIAEYRGEVYALFNRSGAIVNLDRQEIVVRDPALQGGHNLHFANGGVVVYVNDTLGHHVMCYDLTSGRPIRKFSVSRFLPARRLEAGYRAKRLLHKLGLLPIPPSRPMFIRGLSGHGGDLFVGTSPATIFQIGEETGELISLYSHTRDVRCCIHGLVAVEAG